MCFADMIVYLDPGRQVSDRIAVAAILAAEHGARLIAVDLCEAVSYDGLWQRRRDEIRAEFESAVSARGIEHGYRHADKNASVPRDFFVHDADLLIVTQPNFRSAPNVPTGFAEGLLLNAGVPMLLLPEGWTSDKPIGRRPIICWNGTGEATRAVHDAVPLLRKADRASLFTFAADYDVRDGAVQDFVSHLRHHGARVDVDGWRDDGQVDWLSALFACLDREESDLIVSGAYGHSRMAERLFGGATRDLLEQTLVPVFMSH